MPLLIDLYCKAGGAAMGYHRAGFEVIGIDKSPQKNYPFRFIQSGAIEFLDALITNEKYEDINISEINIFHASPPCQKNSTMTKGLWKDRLDNHPELIGPTRERFITLGKPYIIENVPTAPLINPIVLCGSMFGLKVRRHRLFETSFDIAAKKCNHADQGKVVAVYGHSGGSSKRDGIKFGGVDTWKDAMQIDWMIGSELAEAIPPSYTEYIGNQFKFGG